MSGWRWTRAHPLHMEVFRFVDDIQGVRVDRVGGGGERVAVGVSDATRPVWAR